MYMVALSGEDGYFPMINGDRSIMLFNSVKEADTYMKDEPHTKAGIEYIVVPFEEVDRSYL